MLRCDSKRKFFTNSESVSSCLELLDVFCDGALQSDYSPWRSVEAHWYEKKAEQIASDVESSSSLIGPAFVFEKLPEQRRRPAQRQRIDLEKTYDCSVANFLAGKLRSIRKTSHAESS